MYASTKGAKKIVESDHKVLFAKFELRMEKSMKVPRTEVFNFKDFQSQQLSFADTNCVRKYRDNLNTENVDEYSKAFTNMMNKTFHKYLKR